MDYKKLFDIIPHNNRYIITENEVVDFIKRTKEENELLKEDLTTLEEEITRLYNIMQGSKISRDQDIEEI